MASTNAQLQQMAADLCDSQYELVQPAHEGMGRACMLQRHCIRLVMHAAKIIVDVHVSSLGARQDS